MKRLITAFAVCFLTLFCCQFSVLPVSATTSGTTGDCTWSLDGTVLTISGTGEMENFYYNESSPWGKSVTKVVISDGVTSIGDYAFYDCSSLISITIPDSVTSIGYYAFSYCSGLTSVMIPDSVTSIGQDAFFGCENLNAVYITDLAAWCKILFFPRSDGFSFGDSNPLYHGGDLYCNDELVTDLQIPKGITNIGDYAFYGCGSLTSVTIPDGVTSIGADAFAYCSGLTSVTIPDSVTSIGNGAFSNCSGLTSVTIPDNMTSISGRAFAYCSGLTSVTIPDGVTSIGEHAFSYCSGLTSITIPDSVTSIGENAFYWCDNLNAVYITDLAAWCEMDFHSPLLYYAKNLYLNGTLLSGDIVIPDGVTSIGNGAFSNCSGLTSVAIPDGVTSIGSQAFSYCSGLTSITIPDSVTSIGTYAFSWCDNLNAVYITDLAAWCQIEFKTNSYDRHEANPLSYAKKLYCNGILVTELEIPDGVTSIGDYAFYRFSGLTSVAIPDGVTSIGSRAFYYCSGLTSITIPDSVTSIGSYAFENSLVIDIACFENSYAHTYAINQGFSYLFLPSTPGAPTIESAGGNSVTLAATEGYQYSIDKKVWQDSPRFDKLSPLTTYIFYQRIKAKDLYASSYASPGMVMTKPIAAVPPAPIIDNVTADSITLKAVTGYQYSKDGIEWQESPLFESLSPNTLYTFYQRVAESENAYFSAASAASTVLTKKNTYTDVVLNPDFSCVMATSIELIAIEGYEYSLDGVTWQQSPLFNDLKPETVYTLYQRVVETDTTYASEASSVLIVTTLKGYMIFYDAGDGEKAPTQQIKTEGIPLALSLQKPTRNGYSFIGWATSPTANVTYVAGAEFAIDENTTLYAKWLKICTACDGNGRIINSRTCGSCGGSGNGMTSCDSCSGSGRKVKSCPAGCYNGKIIINNTTVKTCSTCKGSGSISAPCSSCSGSGSVRDASGAISCNRCEGSGEDYFFSTCSTCAGKGRVKESVDAIPGTPIFLQITATSVQLQEVDFCEYSCNGTDWQDSLLFDALQPNVTYTFYQRFKETETHSASQSSSVTVTTPKLASQSIVSPIVTVISDTSITLTVVEGAEYSLNGTVWQDSHLFQGLSPNTQYTFYQRYKETNTTYAGESSIGTIARTNKGSQSAPSAPILINRTDNTVVLQSVNGYEYSRDGVNWQSSSIFSGLLPETNYLFYQRKAETDTHYASNMSEALTVKTKEIGILVEIVVETMPKKTVFVESTSLDDAGMVLKLVYSNGTTEMITTGWISEYDFSVMGTRQVKVSYGGKTCTYSVTVVKKSLTSIAIQTSPNKLVYLEGDGFDTTGLTLIAYYDNGTHDIITSNWVVTGYNSTPGTKTITVTYGGKTTTFTVTVNAKTLTSIAVTKKPTKLMYTEGEAFNKSGLVVTAYYNNGTNATVAEYTVSGYSSTSGTKTITVSYGGKTANFTVTVNKKPVVTGDANGDGKVTITDMISIKSVLLGKSTLTGDAAKAADTNGDGKITITDFIQVKSHLLGKSRL